MRAHRRRAPNKLYFTPALHVHAFHSNQLLQSANNTNLHSTSHSLSRKSCNETLSSWVLNILLNIHLRIKKDCTQVLYPSVLMHGQNLIQVQQQTNENTCLPSHITEIQAFGGFPAVTLPCAATLHSLIADLT